MVWRKNSQQNFFGWPVITGFRFFFLLYDCFLFQQLVDLLQCQKKQRTLFFLFIVESVFCFVSPLNIRMHFWPKKFDELFTKLLFSPVKIKEISSVFPCSLRYFLLTKFFCGFWLQQETNETLKVLIKRLNNSHCANHCTTLWKSTETADRMECEKGMSKAVLVLTQLGFNSRENFSLLLQVWV